MGLFDLLSLIYIFVGVRTIWTAIKQWRAFTDDDLTIYDRQLANGLAFFVLVPVGVLFHELGHAAATYQMGGAIDWLGGGFHYAFFYGYVVPQGRFSAFQDWWISLAGNLVSVLFVFLALGILPLVKAAWMKFTLLAFARTQFVLTLIGYPLMSLFGFFGDWISIYGTSWRLTIPTALVHLCLVGGFWLIDRSLFVRRWDLSLSRDVRARLRELDAAIAARPGSVDPLIARGNYFAEQTQTALALADYRAALRLDPHNPRALYNIGQMHLLQKRFTNAEKEFRAALGRATVGGDPQLAARVHCGLGLALFHRGSAAEAAREFGEALARLPDVPEFYYWRGLARRAARDEANARGDFERAAALAETTNSELARRAREMMMT
jgi:tetratricopeptide (TPR) repeat protein